MKNEPRLEIRDVTKYYFRGGSRSLVLDRINFAIEQGMFVSIVGASGCGKTTMLRIVHGLEHATSGAVLIEGAPVVGPGPNRGFVFQDDRLLPWRTVEKNIGYGLEMLRVPRKTVTERVAELVEVVGLKGFEGHYPHEISGGMRQRANLARAMAIRPEILLMDEPFAALDAQTREIMQEELLRIWRTTQSGVVLFITHQIDEAVFLSDRVIVMESGPGRIHTIVEVTLPRPRTLAMKRSPEFLALVDRIWGSIEKDVRKSMDSRYAAHE